MKPDGRVPIARFVRAVLYGALAAAAPMLVFTLVLGVLSVIEGGFHRDGNMWPSLYLMALPLLVTVPLVVAASLLIGVPLTFLLRRTNRESEAAYTICGAIAGFLIPLVGLSALGALAGYWMTLLGAIGGAITGQTWSRKA